MKCFIVLILITLNSVFAQNYILNRDTLSKYQDDILKLNIEFNNYHSVLALEKQTSSTTLSIMDVIADKYTLIESYFEQLWLTSITDSYDLNSKNKKHFQNLKPEIFRHIESMMRNMREAFFNERSNLDNKIIVENFDRMIKLIDNFLKKFEAGKK